VLAIKQEQSNEAAPLYPALLIPPELGTKG
jgi:hypothetical protein